MLSLGLECTGKEKRKGRKFQLLEDLIQACLETFLEPGYK